MFGHIHMRAKVKHIREHIKNLKLGEGDGLLFYNYIPDDLKLYIKRKAKRDGFRVTFNDEEIINFSYKTVQSQEVYKKEQTEHWRAEQDRLNCPG